MRGNRRSLIPIAFKNLDMWAAPDTLVLSEQEKERYMTRREAVEMYAAGEAFSNITTQTGKGADEVTRLVKRCVTSDGQGAIFGFNALISGTRVRPYVRTKPASGSSPSGNAGLLSQLFHRFPELETNIEDLLFKENGKSIVHEARISFVSLHKAFMAMLREKGFASHDWPFNTANCGYKALHQYCIALRDRRLNRWIKVRSGNDAARRSSVGLGFRSLIPALRPFGQMQLDFHKIDAACIIVLINEYGVEIEVPLSRWHIGILVDERSRAVLGLCIALEANPTSDDVLEVIESAIHSDDEHSNRSAAAVMVNGKVLPNQLFPELAYLGFSALKMDNAWSNCATEVVNNIIDTVGCAINFGPVRAWWRRPLVERIFKELTNKGLQRLPSTYGIGPSDTKRNDPNGSAIQYRIMLSDVIEIIYKIAEQFNNAPSESTQASSPNEILRAALNNPLSGFVSQPLPRIGNDQLLLMRHVEECVVHSNIDKHVRPYVQSDRCRYTNEYLANSYGLTGKVLVLYIHRMDVRDAYGTIKDTGEEIGRLVPEKRWARYRISVRLRKLINRSALSKRLKVETEDPIASWGRGKAEELATQRQGKRRKKRSSIDALQLAKLDGDHLSSDASLSRLNTFWNSTEPSTNLADPFGMSDIPQVTSAERRSK